MTADQLIQYLSWSTFALIFVSVIVKMIRYPARTNVDIALLFTLPVVIAAITIAMRLALIRPGPLLTAIAILALLAIAYMLLRLVADFSVVPVLLMRVAEGWLAALVVGALVFVPRRSAWLILLMLLYLLVFLIYAAVAFIREARRSSGVTRRRMQAAALGSLFLGLTFLISGLNMWLPAQAELWRVLSDAAGFATAFSYFLGFAPPAPLRRLWQEPELRAFLGRAAAMPRLPDMQSIIFELERGTASSIGAPNARIGLWDEARQVLRFTSDQGEPIEYVPSQETTTGRAFLAQRPVFKAPARKNSLSIALGQSQGVYAVLAAPISTGEKRLGVLVVYAPRAPIFASADLELVQLLADQAAVVLESRALIDESLQMRARAETARLKEDFLSAAAHDLKTPLTTIVAQAQMLERRVLRAPDAPADIKAIQQLVREGQRLKRLVLELLDATQTEQGRLVGQHVEFDLVALVREICDRRQEGRHSCVLDSNGPVVGRYDQNRILQLIENLVENAVKYSPEGGEVRVKVWREAGQAHLTVADSGIGIPAKDLPFVFDRFHRGANVDDRRFAGMGLGLFICRGIVEQHGGCIWADSRLGQGSTFHVTLPLNIVGDLEHA